MQLDDFLLKKYKLENLNFSHAMIREGFVLVNGRAVLDETFPVSVQDETSFTKEGIETKPLSFFSFLDLSKNVRFESTHNILSYGLLKEEYELLNQRKPIILAICLENAIDSVPAGIKKYIGNPFGINLADEFKGNRKFDFLIIGLRLNTFQVAKLIDMNNPFMAKNAKLLVKIEGDEQTTIDFRNALEKIVGSIGVVSMELLKPKYSKNIYWLLLEKTK